MTSGEVEVQSSASTSRAEHERDVAQREAAQARTLMAAEQERNDKVMGRLLARNEFEDNTWRQIDRIEARVKKIRAEGSLSRESRMLLESVAERRVNLAQQLEEIHRVPQVEWEGFKQDVDSALSGIARDVEVIERKR